MSGTETDDVLADFARAEAWLARAKADYLDPTKGRDRHETTVVRLGDHDVEIDLPLAPMIRAMRDNGIGTTACCQGDDGPDGEAFVCFAAHDDALRFARHVIPVLLLLRGAIPSLGGISAPWEVGEWRWSTWVLMGDTEISFGVRLDFPLAHAAEVTRALERPAVKFQIV